MKSKKILIIILIVILIGVGGGVIYFQSTTKTQLNYNGSKISLLLNQVENQKNINEKLTKISKDKRYTFNEPYVELNPYKISPLSAIIIFNMEEETTVDLYINDEYVTKMESSKQHIIPVYGLIDNYKNIIKLVCNEETKEIEITTEDSKMPYPLTKEFSTQVVNNQELYFTVASYKTYITGWDSDARLRFYLTVDNRMDIEWLSNGHFLVGVSDGQFAENFLGFVEMDYLGKIYNYYTTDHGYSFEFQALSTGDYMMTGGNKPVYVDEQYIYIMDPKTGNIKSSLNLAESILKIDGDFDKVLLGQKAIRNAFYYNESTDELLLSFRGLDAVISYNYSTGTINWVFTDPANEIFSSSVWDEYKVTLKSGRYPLGEHSVIFTSEGNIAFFNNGYNRYHGFENGGNDFVSDYKDNYSSAEIYSINNKEAKLVLSIDDNKKLFSHQYGSINELPNGNYLVDFGYCLKDDYRASLDGILSKAESGPDNIYAKIMEVTKTGKVVYSAVSEEGKFRAFKHSLYNETTENTKVSELNVFNNITKDKLNKLKLSDIDYKNANEWIYDYSLTLNAFKTNYEIKSDDVINIYFVNKKNEVFELNYKEKNSKRNNRIYNLDLESGKYRVYISINDTLFELNQVYYV